MRVLVADNQPKVRHALCVLLEHQLELKVAGEAAAAEELLALAETSRPELVSRPRLGERLKARLQWNSLQSLSADPQLPALRALSGKAAQ